jgi:hypothetical protein
MCKILLFLRKKEKNIIYLEDILFPKKEEKSIMK